MLLFCSLALWLINDDDDDDDDGGVGGGGGQLLIQADQYLASQVNAVVQYWTHMLDVAGSVITLSNASNLQQVANVCSYITI